MGISIFLDFVIFLAISFFVKKKKLHEVEYIFVFVSMVFIHTSYFSIIVDNLGLLKAAEKPIPYTTYRVAEIILFPLLTLWFLDLYYLNRRPIYKVLISLLFLISPWLIERWLINIKIIEYKNWEGYQTIVAWCFFYISSLLIQYVVRRLLIKEGIIDDSSYAGKV